MENPTPAVTSSKPVGFLPEAAGKHIGVFDLSTIPAATLSGYQLHVGVVELNISGTSCTIPDAGRHLGVLYQFP